MIRIYNGLFLMKHGFKTICSVYIEFLNIRKYDQYRRRNKFLV